MNVENRAAFESNEHFVRIREARYPGKPDHECLDVAVIRRIPRTRKKVATTMTIWHSDPFQTRGGLHWGPKFQEQIDYAVRLAASLNKQGEKKWKKHQKT